MPAKRNPARSKKKKFLIFYLFFFFVLFFLSFFAWGVRPRRLALRTGPPPFTYGSCFHVVPTLAVVGSLVM